MPIDHKRSFIALKIALITVSDTRDIDTDRSGALLAQRIQSAGHHLCRRNLVKDEQKDIEQAILDAILKHGAQCVLTNGGTGVCARDVTPEALQAIISKPIPGFGELFRAISFNKIATSSIQ
ncbi:MAG: molybdopterin-binding protein, partial [Pseudomonadota bacterium]